MSPQDPIHSYVCTVLRNRLLGAYRGDVEVREEKPLEAGPDSLPEPDLAVVRGSAADYLKRHPTGADTLLVVEVARSSLSLDRQKASVYARAGVPVFWIVDVGGRRLEAHSEPQPDGRYRLVRVLGIEDRVAVPGVEQELLVGEILPE